MNTLSMETLSLTTDALPAREIQCVSPQVSKKSINNTVLQCVEQELEEFEKISILFLLAAEQPGAYKIVRDLCQGIKERPNIISEFVANDFELWREKLIEALCIIDNREILRNLGFSPEILADTYHQNIPGYTAKVHKVSKILYKLFDSLGRDETYELLRYIYEEDRIPRQFDNKHYLELHAFYWLDIGYISISSDGGNLSKLLKHLKRMDCCRGTLYHDIERFATASNQSDSCNAPKTVSLQCPETPTQDGSRSPDNTKLITEIKKGKCVIVNEVKFPAKFEQREGSDRDRDALKKAFSALGFDISTRDNLTERELKDFLKQTSEEFDTEKYNCLVFCILTHGYEGGIITSDGKEISNAVIEDKICTWKLRDTIKLLIVQACQGKITGDASTESNLTTDGGGYENNLRFRHFGRFMSTMDGFASIRHKIKGSWFIQILCEELSHQGRITVSDWTASVIQKVTDKKGCVNGCPSASQIPEFTSRLAARIYFPELSYSSNETVAPTSVARQ